MNKFILITFLNLVSVMAFSAPAKYFYECGGLAHVDEYRVGINLNSNRAGFFDNDSTSYMKLTETKVLEGKPQQVQMIFEGNEASYTGTLKLYFNLTKKTVSLYSIDANGKSTKVGSARCVNVEPWDDLD